MGLDLRAEQERGFLYANWNYARGEWAQVYKNIPNPNIVPRDSVFLISAALEMQRNGVVPVKANQNVVVLPAKSPEERAINATAKGATTGVITIAGAGALNGLGWLQGLGIVLDTKTTLLITAAVVAIDVFLKYVRDNGK